MRVKCVLCDKIKTINDDLPLAKRLRNRPIHTYMCEPCEKRITEKTLAKKQQAEPAE
ncbi:YlaI family protein [Halalkalibacterium ligniniphilum]|uniref:YlaI family protein n=1 Tax=Halalkalibacterium ligniniphilum TaxID=1134413 RepID=UPI00034B96C4|nr:YlaI family protein [Halalkalibacterium ligniniphilum]